VFTVAQFDVEAYKLVRGTGRATLPDCSTSRLCNFMSKCFAIDLDQKMRLTWVSYASVRKTRPHAAMHAGDNQLSRGPNKMRLGGAMAETSVKAPGII
jgi:hypothetical protein